MKRGWSILAIAFLAFTACSNSDIDAQASRNLRARVDQIRATADGGDLEGARVQLGALERAVSRWERRGDLTGDRANEILDAAAAVAAALDAAAPPFISPSPSTSEPPKPEKPKHHGKNDKAPGHGGD